ncbi:MAG TPA: dockerin type I domain-containing protein [Gemmataceae bacterium]|jgi:hypothetical protein
MLRSRRFWYARWVTRWLSPARTFRRDPTRLRLLPLEDRTVPSTYTVTGTGDAGTGTGTTGDLRYCITQANASTGTADVIRFNGDPALGPPVAGTNFYDGIAHTITLTSALPVTDSVTITGAGAGLTVVNAGGNDRVFDVYHAGAGSPLALAATFHGLTITGGSAGGAGGGIRFEGAASVTDTLTIEDSTVSGNAVGGGPDAAGGGVYFNGQGTTGDALTITGSAVTGNGAFAGDAGGVGGTAVGGGVYAVNAAVTVTDSTLASNLAQGGDSDEPPTDPLLSGAAYGGGLYAAGGAVTVADSTFIGNAAKGGKGDDGADHSHTGAIGGKAFGGGLFVTDTASAAVSGSVVANNLARAGDTKVSPYDASSAIGYGGGLAAYGAVASMTVADCTIGGNTAAGGLVSISESKDDYVDYPNAAVAGVGDGGGLFFHSALGSTSSSALLFLMTDSEVDGNLAVGGAMNDADSGRASAGVGACGGMDVLTTVGANGGATAQGEALGSTFAHNVARGGAAMVTNVNISGKTSGSAYGGLAFAGGVAVSRLINSTVYGNSAVGGAASCYNQAGHIFTAVAGYAGGGGFGPGAGGSAYGLLFDDMSTTYLIANSTIVGNAAVPGVMFPEIPDDPASGPAPFSFGGGVDDGSLQGNWPFQQSLTLQSDANVELYSTIVAGNSAITLFGTAPPYPGPDIVGGDSANGASHNLIGSADPSAPNFPVAIGPNGPAVPNSNLDLVGPDSGGVLDPGLSAFGFHGGPTKTLVPQPGGLALDAGENDPNGTVHPAFTLTYDQRDTSPFARTSNQTSMTALNYSDGTDVGAVESRGATPVQVVDPVQIDDGSAQGSIIRSITVTFTMAVTFANNDPTAAFQLTRTGTWSGDPDGTATGNVALTPTVSTDGQGRTVVVLTFSGQFTDGAAPGVDPSLIDGLYTLTVFSNKVTGANGLALDGDFDGNAGGDYSPMSAIHRLFGDGNGDEDTDLLDLSAFVAAYNTTLGNPNYNRAFDFDGDGDVDSADLSQLVSRLFAVLP